MTRRTRNLPLRTICSLTALAAWVAPPPGLGAQPVGTTSCGSPGPAGVTIQVTVVDDSTRVPIGGSRVHLLAPICSGVTDSIGRFVFTDVRPGSQLFDAGHFGYRDFGRFQTTADPGESLEIELRLRAGGPIQDCRVRPACAPLFQDPPVDGLDEVGRFNLLALGTAIALGWQRYAPGGAPMYACVAAAPLQMQVLKARYAQTVDAGECVFPPRGPPGTRTESARHVATGSPAFSAVVSQLRDLDPTHREAMLTISSSRGGGEGWLCRFERTETAWRPIACELSFQAQ